MNHPIDLDPESCRRADPEISRRVLCRSGCDPAEGAGATRQSASCQPKIRDALKAIQLREKLSEAQSVGVAKTSEADKFFWEETEAIRRSELPKLYPEPTSLESQIQDTILGLKDLVKNAILPLKTVTQTFNQARSKQGRLTYRRMGRLLSAMGFTSAKTPNGCSAIIWDDKLLFKSPSQGGHRRSVGTGVSMFAPARSLDLAASPDFIS